MCLHLITCSRWWYQHNCKESSSPARFRVYFAYASWFCMLSLCPARARSYQTAFMWLWCYMKTPYMFVPHQMHFSLVSSVPWHCLALVVEHLRSKPLQEKTVLNTRRRASRRSGGRERGGSGKREDGGRWRDQKRWGQSLTAKSGPPSSRILSSQCLFSRRSLLISSFKSRIRNSPSPATVER